MNAGRRPGSSPGFSGIGRSWKMPVSIRMPKCLVPVRLMNSMYSSTTSCLIGVGEWISGQMITSSSSASGRRCFDDLGPDRVRHQVARDDADLRPDEPEPEPLGQPQVALQRRGALLDGHVAAVRAAGVQAGVDPRAVVGGLEAVLLEQRGTSRPPTPATGSGSSGCAPRRGSRCRSRRCRRCRPSRSRGRARCRSRS